MLHEYPIRIHAMHRLDILLRYYINIVFCDMNCQFGNIACILPSETSYSITYHLYGILQYQCCMLQNAISISHSESANFKDYSNVDMPGV